MLKIQKRLILATIGIIIQIIQLLKNKSKLINKHYLVRIIE
jgi:hypothetical protein